MTTTTTPASFVYRTQLLNSLGNNPTFAGILRHHVRQFQATGQNGQLAFNSLSSGTTIIRTAEQANAYLTAYGDMHRIKLDSAFEVLTDQLSGIRGPIEVIDWGCGQGLASGVLLDFVQLHGLALDIRRFTLIEPSTFALNRAVDHLHILQDSQPFVVRSFNQTADSLSPSLMQTNPQAVKIHLFSNLLDMPTVDYKAIARTIRQSQRGLNLFVCVSPLIGHSGRDPRLEAFRQEFATARSLSVRTTSLLGLVFLIRAMRPGLWPIQRNESIFSVQL